MCKTEERGGGGEKEEIGKEKVTEKEDITRDRKTKGTKRKRLKREREDKGSSQRM